jgi:homoserine kinase
MKRIFAPATIGNVGPGFDVLGLAIDGLGDIITATPTEKEFFLDSVSGRDASLVPLDTTKNVVSIAAKAYLENKKDSRGLRLSIEKSLPISGGLGGSAASSVAGALAAAAVYGYALDHDEIFEAALVGEAAVSGRHLDNIAPCVLGGLTLVRSQDPFDVISIPVRADWWVAVCTPNIKVETKAARAVLPPASERREWIQQMANTAALVHAFSLGDAALLSRALQDVFAEPRRASLIPGFYDAKKAALDAGALACSISGAGPTLFAICESQARALSCLTEIRRVFGDASSGHVGEIAKQGARVLS